MRQNPVDIEWLEAHARPRFWRRFVAAVNGAKPSGAPDVEECWIEESIHFLGPNSRCKVTRRHGLSCLSRWVWVSPTCQVVGIFGCQMESDCRNGGSQGVIGHSTAPGSDSMAGCAHCNGGNEPGCVIRPYHPGRMPGPLPAPVPALWEHGAGAGPACSLPVSFGPPTSQEADRGLVFQKEKEKKKKKVQGISGSEVIE